YRQQKTYAKHDVSMYLDRKDMIGSDNVTNRGMLFQPLILIGIVILGLTFFMFHILTFVLGHLSVNLFNIFLTVESTVLAVVFLVLLALNVSFFYSGIRLCFKYRDPTSVYMIPLLFWVRAIAWMVGGIQGILQRR
ncbi:MAG: hypothetical protein ACTSW4_06315, partial [Candidatus Ranarchaeia archaeon]